MPGETYELTTKTRTNLSTVLDSRRDEILKMSAENIRQMGPAFFLRAITTLTTNPDTDKLLTSRKGIDTALKAITDAAMVGISFGGPKPQAYFVPKDGGVLMIPTAAGIRHAVCYGVGAILRTVPELITVKEGDGVKIDPAKGTVNYTDGGFDPFDANRGKVKGFIMRLQFKDNRPDQVRHIGIEKVRQIEAHYGMTGGPAYKKSPEEQDEKTAIKWMLRDVFAESAGLAQMILEGDGDLPEDQGPPPVERDVTARTIKTVDAAVARLDPEKAAEPVEEDPPAEDVEQEAQADPEHAETGAEEDLFK